MRGPAGPTRRGRVWDPLVRLVHWILVAAFATAWFERSEAAIHENAGKLVLVLAIVRVVWGIVGTGSARFASFVRGPRATFAYLTQMARGKPGRYLGHNPAGAAMIGALLLALATTAITGILMSTVAFWGNAWVEWLHGTAATVTVWLIAAHLIGVALACLQHRENLPLSMITGDKTVPLDTPRHLGGIAVSARRIAGACAFALAAAGLWTVGAQFLDSGLWRMEKIIAASLKQQGCAPATLTGPRIAVYPQMLVRYDAAFAEQGDPVEIAIPAWEALKRRPDISDIAARACRELSHSLPDRGPMDQAATDLATSARRLSRS